MNFVPYRILRNQPKVLRERLKNEGQLVITSNGEPMALLLDIEPDQIEETIKLIAQLRAQQAVSMMRQAARDRGLEQLDEDAIEAEIQAARSARK
jgi:hypothetical protein